MKTTLATILGVGLLSGLLQAQEQEPLDLSEQMAKVSYGIGMNLGFQWVREEIPINPDILARGMKDAMAGKTLITEQEMGIALSEYRQQHQAKMNAKRKQLGEKNKAEGDEFLAENKEKPGVITLPSGLQYKVLEPGDGESPKANDMVTVNYRGTLLDGTEFDSSYPPKEPVTFAVNRVIKGWTEALQLMRPGAKWQLFIPPKLAYGEFGSGQKIGPNATLVFDVELISVKPAPAPAATPSTSSSTPVVTSDIIKVPSKEELERGAKIEVIKKEDVERLQREAQQKKEAEAKKQLEQE